MDFKKTAQDLLKLAEKIEKEASDNSYFICSQCNHTATLTQVNDRRVMIASQENPEMTVKKVTINDTIRCGVPGCEGKMTYCASDESNRYYLEEKKADEGALAPEEDSLDIDKILGDTEEEKPKAKKPPVKLEDKPEEGIEETVPPAMPEVPKTEPEVPAAPAPNPETALGPKPEETPPPASTEGIAPEGTPPEDISAEPEPEGEIKPEQGSGEQGPEEFDVDNLFEDVETQGENAKQEKKENVEELEKARAESTAKKDMALLEEEGEGSGEGPGSGEGTGDIPASKEPLTTPVEKSEPAPEAVNPEGQPGEGLVPQKPKKTPKTKEEELLEKQNVPKFKSKDASERYTVSLSRYSK
jgi:hypothetical protein